jgi:hypothetical protein
MNSFVISSTNSSPIFCCFFSPCFFFIFTGFGWYKTRGVVIQLCRGWTLPTSHGRPGRKLHHIWGIKVQKSPGHRDFVGCLGKEPGNWAVCFTPAKYDFPKCVFPILTNWKVVLESYEIKKMRKTSGNYSAMTDPQNFCSLYLSFELILETWETISSQTWIGHDGTLLPPCPPWVFPCGLRYLKTLHVP